MVLIGLCITFGVDILFAFCVLTRNGNERHVLHGGTF